ncbi:MAG: acyltransferase [Bacteroides sp.]|nr:acyltransferase [Roseburia sp.]MCM1346759.1 acyltransferase [Bacteroides sp.]MCM1421304.1 acyltransferase [Bacteroides sp.]
MEIHPLTHSVNTSAACPPVSGRERMEWLDALRGFTMILVVAYHVAQISFGQSIKLSASLPVLVLFRMPMFFFISGFLAYKPGFNWTRGRLRSMVWKKLKIQVIPAFVFLCVFIVVRMPRFGDGFALCMEKSTKGGYWFTWSLLHMFVVYYVFAYMESRLRLRSWIPIAALWLMALCVYATLYMPSWFSYHKEPFFQYTSLVETLRFFHFFLLGNIVRRYWNGWQRLFDSRWFFPVAAVTAFVCCADVLKWHTLRLQWTNLPRTAAMYLLMLIVFMFFRYYRDCLTRSHRRGRFLQYIGRRTLDIYLLHFIFLPKLTFAGKFLDANRLNFCADIVCAVSVALVVIGFCCLASNILRMSPFFKKTLFGRKQ